MSVRSSKKLSLVRLTGFIFVVLGAAGSTEAAKLAKSNNAPVAQQYNFSLSPVPENVRQYSFVISDGDERSISGVFSVDQLQILRAIMTEAEKFALGEEAVGVKESITTRFADSQEGAFIVDVEKQGNQSRIFLTLKTEIGRMTVDAGRVLRSTRREEGFFVELMSRLESVLTKLPKKPAK